MFIRLPGQAGVSSHPTFALQPTLLYSQLFLFDICTKAQHHLCKYQSRLQQYSRIGSNNTHYRPNNFSGTTATAATESQSRKQTLRLFFLRLQLLEAMANRLDAVNPTMTSTPSITQAKAGSGAARPANNGNVVKRYAAIMPANVRDTY